MSASNMIISVVGVVELRQGSIVRINGRLETVSNSDLRLDSFFGWLYKGASYRSGIEQVKFKVPISGGRFRYEG